MAADSTENSDASDGETRPRRRDFLRAAGASGLAGAAGCLGVLGTEGLTATWTIASPMSGAYESLGPSQRHAAELAIEWINENDDVDLTIEATYEDTATDPEAAREAVSKRIDEDGASFVLGAISSDVALELIDLAESKGVVYSTGSAAETVTGADCSSNVFRFETNTAQIAEACAPWTVENLGGRTWFHIADYSYGNSVLAEWRKRMREFSNFEEVGTSKTQLGAGDFADSIEEMKASDADVAVIGMTGGDLVRFLLQAAEMNLPDELDVFTTAGSMQSVRSALGAAGDGIYSGVRYLPKITTGDNNDFVTAYEERTGESPDNFARVGYDGIRMVAQGIAEVGSNDPADVIDALPDTEVSSIFGPNRFRACDHQAENPVWVGQNTLPAGEDITDVQLLDTIDGPDAIPPCAETDCQM